jgi:hypothetical protein
MNLMALRDAEKEAAASHKVALEESREVAKPMEDKVLLLLRAGGYVEPGVHKPVGVEMEGSH